jgi:hypothetical protein
LTKQADLTYLVQQGHCKYLIALFILEKGLNTHTLRMVMHVILNIALQEKAYDSLILTISIGSTIFLMLPQIMEDPHRVQGSNPADQTLLPRPEQPLQILKPGLVSG